MADGLSNKVNSSIEEMKSPVDELSKRIGEGKEIDAREFGKVLNQVNDAMVSAYRTIAPNGRNAENGKYIDQLSSAHKEAKARLNESRREYEKVAEFIKERAKHNLTMNLVVETDAESNVYVSANNLGEISASRNEIIKYKKVFGEMELPDGVWNNQRNDLLAQLEKGSKVYLETMRTMVLQMEAEVDDKVEGVSVDELDNIIAQDDISFWSGEREVPADILATRLSKMRYALDLSVALGNLRKDVEKIPQALGLIAKIDQKLIDIGVYLKKANEHYGELMAVDGKDRRRIVFMFNNYARLCENLKNARESGEAAQISIADRALRQYLLVMKSTAKKVFDYDLPVPDSEVPLDIARFEGFDFGEAVSFEDVQNGLESVEKQLTPNDAKTVRERGIAKLHDLAVGDEVKINGVLIRKVYGAAGLQDESKYEYMSDNGQWVKTDYGDVLARAALLDNNSRVVNMSELRKRLDAEKKLAQNGVSEESGAKEKEKNADNTGISPDGKTTDDGFTV